MLGLFLFPFETNHLEVSSSLQDSILGKVSGVEEFLEQELDLRVDETGDLDDLLMLSYLAAGHCCKVFH